MKRIRRIQVQVERRELSVFLSGSAPDLSSAVSEVGAVSASGSGLLDLRPAQCINCGSTYIEPIAEALADLSMTELRKVIEGGQFHLQQSASGSWWICRRSQSLD
jgi:hypothetical protein